MTYEKRDFGKLGEDKACEYLSGLGYEILDRNYETYSGEIDIVARENGTLVFAEVKTRKTKRYGRAAAAVTHGKLAHIVKAAQCYAKTHKEYSGCNMRVDVIEIYTGKDAELNHIKNVSLEGVV